MSDGLRPFWLRSLTPLPSIPAESAFEIKEIARLNRPWALAFLPDGSLLVSEQAGRLWRVQGDIGNMRAIVGVPAVEDSGQGGLGDVALHPDFSLDPRRYLSYAETGPNHT